MIKKGKKNEKQTFPKGANASHLSHLLVHSCNFYLCPNNASRILFTPKIPFSKPFEGFRWRGYWTSARLRLYRFFRKFHREAPPAQYHCHRPRSWENRDTGPVGFFFKEFPGGNLAL